MATDYQESLKAFRVVVLVAWHVFSPKNTARPPTHPRSLFRVFTPQKNNKRQLNVGQTSTTSKATQPTSQPASQLAMLGLDLTWFRSIQKSHVLPFSLNENIH